MRFLNFVLILFAVVGCSKQADAPISSSSSKADFDKGVAIMAARQKELQKSNEELDKLITKSNNSTKAQEAK